jgi:hypothetical protein
MTDWIITVPKTTKWEEYQKELETVKDRSAVMQYRLPYRVDAVPGERCFVVWNGEVRGWMEIVGVHKQNHSFVCTTTGKYWRPGYYLQRTGPFHVVTGVKMKGFRGIRKYVDIN